MLRQEFLESLLTRTDVRHQLNQSIIRAPVLNNPRRDSEMPDRLGVPVLKGFDELPKVSARVPNTG